MILSGLHRACPAAVPRAATSSEATARLRGDAMAQLGGSLFITPAYEYVRPADLVHLYTIRQSYTRITESCRSVEVPPSPPQRPLIGRAATCEMLLSLLAPALQPHLARRAHLRMSSSPEAGSFELELFSPARLSLFLRVQPRADGLHDVARLSQAIDLGDRLQLARIPNTPSQAAGVVRPSRKTDPIKQHVEFSATPVGLPGLPAGLLRESGLAVVAPRLASPVSSARQPGLLGPPARPRRVLGLRTQAECLPWV